MDDSASAARTDDAWDDAALAPEREVLTWERFGTAAESWDRSWRTTATPGEPHHAGDTLVAMTDVSIRDLRNHGGDVVDRAAAGERIIITRSGRPVAELIPLRRAKPTPEELIERWKQLPPLDPQQLRDELDSIIDPSL